MEIEKIRIWDGSFGHYENGWSEISYQSEIPDHPLLTRNENTVWQKGECLAFGEKNTWGQQVGCAVALHKSHIE